MGGGGVATMMIVFILFISNWFLFHNFIDSKRFRKKELFVRLSE